MTSDSPMNPESERDRAIDPPNGARSRIRQGDRVELFAVALTLSLGVGAVLLAVLTRKHLFARQIAPPESPIQVT
jgi:hypothetical protein